MELEIQAPNSIQRQECMTSWELMQKEQNVLQSGQGISSIRNSLWTSRRTRQWSIRKHGDVHSVVPTDHSHQLASCRRRRAVRQI